MYKFITVLAILSFSHLASANEKTNVWSCVDSSKLNVEATCLMNVLDVKTNTSFYTKLEQVSFETQTDAFATITHFPQDNLIVVKSLESKLSTLKDKAQLVAFNQ